ncbi:hypothetical protein N7488_004420 [Penicillium malachiteum]|nr:hypothetical protein N7488_004420 [Penicillium malachiteum]
MNYGHPASQGPARSNQVRGHQVGDPATNQMAGFLRKNPTYGPGSRNNREYRSQQDNRRNKNNYNNNQNQFNDHTNQKSIPEARNWNNDRSPRGRGKNRSPRIENAQANFNRQTGQPNGQFIPHRQPNRGPNPRPNPQQQLTTAQGYNKDHRHGWGFYNSSASGQDWQQARRNKQNKNPGIQKPGANSSRRQRNPNLDAHLWKVSCGEEECWKVSLQSTSLSGK